MEDFEGALLREALDVECPKCGYPVWIQMVDVVAGCFVRCPACRGLIQLVDDRGSVATAYDDIGRAINELGKEWS
jgi:hypothetical protein